MYSLDKDIEFNKKEIDVSLEGEENNDIIQVNEKVMIEDINSIIDVSADVSVVNKTVSGKYINYELDAILNIIYETDNRNGINSKKVNIPCMTKLGVECDNIKFEISKSEFNVNNEELNCEIEILCKSCKDSSKKIAILEDIEEKECEIKNEYSMVVYFVKPCDTIWKIAKMFKVTVDSIIQANNLENPDKINVGEKLYIVK